VSWSILPAVGPSASRPTRLRPFPAAARACGLALLGIATGCGPDPSRGGFDSPDPAARLYAIDRSVRDFRAERARGANGQYPPAVPEATRIGLVASLGSDDPLVRMNAALALQEMTGQTYGYRFDDPPAVRLLALERWRAWAIGEAAR